MVDSLQRIKDSKKECDEIELLYDNLEFISKAYYSAEGIFPFWESAFALIVGQILLAYFEKGQHNPILILCGLIFSFFWFRLVSLNRQHAKYLAYTMKSLEFKLIQKYRKKGLKFYTESPPENFSLCENRVDFFRLNASSFAELRPTKAWKSTWYFRRILPLSLILLWMCIIVYEVVCNLPFLSTNLM